MDLHTNTFNTEQRNFEIGDTESEKFVDSGKNIAHHWVQIVDFAIGNSFGILTLVLISIYLNQQEKFTQFDIIESRFNENLLC